MVSIVKSFIRKYGTKVKIVTNNNTINKRGFIYPLYNKSKYYYKSNLHDTGRFDQSHYLLITEPKAFESVSEAVQVYCNGQKYLSKSNGTYVVNNKEIYVWAVLSACTDPLEDDYERN